jgi:hypothetical protein
VRTNKFASVYGSMNIISLSRVNDHRSDRSDEVNPRTSLDVDIMKESRWLRRREVRENDEIEIRSICLPLSSIDIVASDKSIAIR